MTKCLLLGGPNDGERVDVDTGQRQIRIMPPFEVPLISDKPSTSPTVEVVKAAIYERRQFRGGDRIFYIYTAEGVDDEDMTERLIDGYRQP